MSDAHADALKGEQIYLHHSQKEPSWHGGTVVSWEPMTRRDDQMGKAFIYTIGPTAPPPERWAQMKAFVYES